MLTEWLLLLVGILLTLGTAVFVAAEFAFVTLDRFTVEKAVEDGDGAPPVSCPRCAPSPPSSPAPRSGSP